jgi:hypothetical protein
MGVVGGTLAGGIKWLVGNMPTDHESSANTRYATYKMTNVYTLQMLTNTHYNHTCIQKSIGTHSHALVAGVE